MTEIVKFDPREVGKVMRTALAPYRLNDELRKGHGVAIDKAERLLNARETHTLVHRALESPPSTYDAELWSLHCAVVDTLADFPRPAQIETTLQEITRAITTGPTDSEVQYLIGVMLDGLGIRAGDDTDGYIGAVIYMLADVAPNDVEYWTTYAIPEHVPMPALARAVKEVWGMHGETYGRPPPISQLIERCTSGRLDLCRVRSRIEQVDSRRRELQLIADATKDMPLEDWFDEGT